MAAYLLEVQRLLGAFETFELNQIPRAQNSYADALARLATAQDIDCTESIPVEFLPKPSTKSGVEVMALTVAVGLWMSSLVDYLQEGRLSEDKMEARRLRIRAARYCIYGDVLYKRGLSTPLLRCIDEPKCTALMRDIYEGHYGNHAGGLSLAQKALR